MTAPASSRESSLLQRPLALTSPGARLLLALFLLYLAAGKGFAYFGYQPLFIGEVGLLVLIALAVRPNLILPSGLAPAIAALFVLAGSAQFVNDAIFSSTAKIETMRGFAIVYYASFAILAHALLAETERREGFDATVDRLEGTLSRAVWPMLAMLLLLALRLTTSAIPTPTWPGSAVPMLFTKSTDVSVALAFLLPLIADRRRRHLPHSLTQIAVWAVCTLLVTARSRAGVIAIAVAMLITFGIQARYVIRGLFIAAACYLALLVSGFSVRAGSRELSARGLRDSVIAIFDPASASGGSFTGTTRWRTNWWKAIWNDIEARGMWFRANGWGTNLAAKYLAPDSVPNTAFTSLRLPHSTFFSIAGRAGVAAAVLFLLIPTATFLTSRQQWVKRRTSPALQALQITLLSGVAVGLTDVYIESPQGGIVFWCCCGALWWWARRRRQPMSDL